MSSLEAINFGCCFFTTADYEDALLSIDNLLAQYRTYEMSTETFFDRDKKIQLLEKAYKLALHCLSATENRKPEPKLIFLIGDVVRLYAHLFFMAERSTCRSLSLISFDLQLYAMGMSNQCFDLCPFKTLHELQARLQRNIKLADSIEELMLTTHVDSYISTAFTHTLALSAPTKRLFALADTARLLCCCYQQEDGRQADEKRCELLFTLSEGLFLLMNDEVGTRELGGLYYQILSRQHRRKSPSDLDGLFAIYDKALAYDHSTEMQVKIANCCFAVLFNVDRKKEAITYLRQALLDIKMLADTEDSRYLIAEVHHHFAEYCLEPETIDLEEAERSLNIAVQYASQSRLVGIERKSFVAFDMHQALLKLVLGDLPMAKEAIMRAVNALQKHALNYEELADKIKVLQAIIDDSLQAGKLMLD